MSHQCTVNNQDRVLANIYLYFMTAMTFSCYFFVANDLSILQASQLTYCHGSWICVLILCSSMWVDPLLCLSALPSDHAPDEVIRTVTGVARLHCLYLAGVSVVRCQIVFYSCGFLLSVSVFQVRRLFSPGRVSVFPEGWRLCTAGFTAPALPVLLHLHCR